jgi:hypothetical protein
MPTTPPLNRILLTAYIILTLVVGAAALIWPSVRGITYAPLRDLLFPNLFLPTRAGMPVTLAVAAPAALEDWVRASAGEFTRQNTLIQIEVTAVRGSDANRRLNSITSQPDAWIAEADFVRIAAGGLPYETQGKPVAQGSFVWVAVKGHSELAGQLSWNSVSQSAGSNPQFRIAMPPVDSIEGMAACWSAAAEYHHLNQVTADQINDRAFRTWLSALLQAAPDRNRSPLDQLATRPPQAEVGLILASDWGHLPQDGFIDQPPANNVAFNYPYYIRTVWQDMQPDEAAARQEAAGKFRDYLLSAAPQNRLSAYGLKPASAQLTGQLPPLDEPAIRALRFCWQ